MPLITTTLSGAVPLPDGSAPEGAVLRFALSGVDFDGAVVAPVPLDCPVTGDGAVEVALWPNARGTNATRYGVTLILPRTADLPERQIRLGEIAVPDTGTALLHDLL